MKVHRQNVTSEGDEGWGITCVHRQNVPSSFPLPHAENNLHQKSSSTQHKARAKQIKKKQVQRGNERRGQPFLTAGDGEPYGSRVGDGAGGPRRRGRESPPPPPATEAEEARGS